MKKFNQYLIVSDLDGTFLGERGTLVPKNLKAIRYFVDNGGLFTIATGRDFRVLKYVFPNARDFISCPAILCNGCYLYDFNTERMQGVISLNKEELLPILDRIYDQFPNIGYRISFDLGFLCPDHVPLPFQKDTSLSPIIVRGRLKDYIEYPWHKLVFVGSPLQIQSLSEFVSTLPLRSMNTTTSSPELLELLPRGAGKGNKLGDLKNLYSSRTIVGVGDFENDFDLLEKADISACPENALDTIKDISLLQLCHHRDGCIADLIYKLDSGKK